MTKPVTEVLAGPAAPAAAEPPIASDPVAVADPAVARSDSLAATAPVGDETGEPVVVVRAYASLATSRASAMPADAKLARVTMVPPRKSHIEQQSSR